MIFKPHKNAGFTLIEVAIAMVAITAIMSGAVISYSHFSNKYKIEQTQEKQQNIMKALSVYAQKNFRLPCPAEPNPADARRAGLEINSTATSPGKCFNISGNDKFNDAIGVVPWKDVGLKEDDVVDAWGRYFTYKPSPHLTVDMSQPSMRDDTNATVLDVHDACRAPNWYDKSGSHVNRAKAMFCCNTPPKVEYLRNATNMAAGGSTDISNWNQLTTMTTQNFGVLNGVKTLGDLPTLNVSTTNQWIEGPETNYGDFESAYAGPEANDLSQLRAGGLALSLVSHGPNGKLAFIPGRSKNDRQMATYDAQGNITANNSKASELEVLNTLQISGGVSYNPKMAGGLVNKTGLKENSSDDVSMYLRTDQLISQIGSASCVNAGNLTPMSPPEPPILKLDGECFQQTPILFTNGPTLTSCESAIDDLGGNCPPLTSTVTNNPGDYFKRDDLNVLRPFSGNTTQCVTGIFGNAAGSAPVAPNGACYVRGYKYTQVACPIVNGECGSSQNQHVAQRPTSGLCNYTSMPTTVEGPFDGSKTWQWKCHPQGTGTTANCWAITDVISGRCGSPDGGSFHNPGEMPYSPEVLCESGRLENFAYNNTTRKWSWTCEGVDRTENSGRAGSSVSCGATLIPPACNDEFNGQLLETPPTAAQRCSHGDPSGITEVGSLTGWSWTCTNSYPDPDLVANCGATYKPPIPGECGSDNGKELNGTPVNLCSKGNPTSVTGNGPWTWQCLGIGTGAPNSPQCSANPIPVIPGRCGSSNGRTDFTSAPQTNLCDSGNLVGPYGSGPWTWSCEGVNSSSRQDCTAGSPPGSCQAGP